MVSIARGQSSSPQNPVLSAFFLAGPGLLDPELIEFAIFERITEEYPLQVFPSLDDPLVTRAVVDIRDAPDGDRLSLGRYVARWQPAPGQDIGRYEIRWWWRERLADTFEFTFAQEFEVIEHQRLRGPAYVFVDDMRAEGVGCGRLKDAELHAKIVRASKLFELYTGRSFVPTYKVLHADGRGHGTLLLNEPIIAVEQLYFSGNRYYSGIGDPRNVRDYRVFNRHLGGLTYPDDRENPRIELAHFGDGIMYGRNFTRGQQNILVRGVFGYTEWVEGGPPAGDVPELVKHAVKLLTFKDLPKLWDVAEREDAQKRWKLTSESTRDQSYGMLGGVDAATRGAVVGGTTGDPEIDNLIILFRRGGQVGAA